MNSETAIPSLKTSTTVPALQDTTEAAYEPRKGQGEPSSPTTSHATAVMAEPQSAPPAGETEEDPLAVGWELFRSFPWRRLAEFVTAYNERFGLRRRPQHFAIQFAMPWKRDLGVSAASLSRLMRLIRLRQAQARAAKHVRDAAADRPSSSAPVS